MALQDSVFQQRSMKKWSREKLAREANVSARTIQEMEGGVDARLSTVKKVMGALGWKVLFVPVDAEVMVDGAIVQEGTDE